MLKYLKPYTELVLQSIARKLPRINPNSITIIGLVPPALFFYFLYQGRYGWAIVCYIGTLFDLFDGAYARATGQVTRFGSLLDSSLDRITDAIIISAFGFAGLVSWWLCISVLIASVMISYVRARGESIAKNPSVLAVGPIERPERLALIFIGLLLFVLFPQALFRAQFIQSTFMVLLFLSIVTVWRRLLAAYKDLRK